MSGDERTEELSLPVDDDGEEDYPEDYPGDIRDLIIQRNQRKMQKMQRNFRQQAESLRVQLHDYVDQSTRIQNEMLDRILQLKDRIQAIKDRQAFAKRKPPSQTKSTSKTRRAKRKRAVKQPSS